MERSGWFTRIYLVVSLLSICVECSTAPEHVHLSVTGDPDEMAVMWFTEDPANSLVQYTKKNYDKKITVKGTATLITASAFASQKPGYMHLAILKNLDPATVYLYSVGSDIDGWSSQFFFKTQPTKSASDHKIHFLAFGDMGVKWENSLRTMRTLAPLARALDIDMVLHAGDLAYAFKNMTLWDLWFDRAQAIAGYVPYMISAGNRDDPEVLRERFVYPKQPWNPNKTQLYYSFDFSWIHFVSISTVKPVESFEEYTPGSDQIRWLEEDLRQARERIDSGKTDLKWIVLYGHTPMYSSSNGHDGGNKVLKAAIESMMYTYGVNIAIWGDDHVYERSYPIYDDIPDTSTMYIDPVTKKQTFVNPDKPIHLLAGTAGIDLDGWLAPEPPVWSAFREMANGFVDIEATQSSLRIKFIRLEDGSIADEFFVTKVLTSGSTMNIGWLLIPAVGAGVLYYIRTSRSFSRRKI